MGIPWREPLALISAALMLLPGLGLLLPSTTKASALTLSAFVALEAGRSPELGEGSAGAMSHVRYSSHA